MQVDDTLERHVRFLHHQIFNLYRSLPKDQPDDLPAQASLFEYYCALEHTKNTGKCVSVWKDIPPQEKLQRNLFIVDKGVDVISHDFVQAYQCKLYGEHSMISYGKLATFLAFPINFDVAHAPRLTLCRLDTSPVASQVQSIIRSGNLTDWHVKYQTFLANCHELSDTYQVIHDDKEVSTPVYELYPHQQHALDVIEQGYRTSQNVIIHLPTGCGKTLTVLHLLLSNCVERILVMVPTLTLLDQWVQEAIDRGIQKHFVCAVGTEHKDHFGADEFSTSQLVVCVYNSFEKMIPFLDSFDWVVMDEAHNLFPPHIYTTEFLQLDCDGNDVSDSEEEDDVDDDQETSSRKKQKVKSTYLTKMIEYVRGHHNSLLLSATIKHLDNFLYYHYPLRQAIRDGTLTDYQVVFPIFKTDPTDRNIVRYFVQRGETHCLVFTSSIAECERITALFNELAPGCASFIHSELGRSQRQHVLDQFESGAIRFLVNVRVLVEGFNSRVCSSIVFFHMPSNQTLTMQAIGRALRKFKHKRVANIYFPYNREDDQTSITQFLRQIAQQDAQIMEEYRRKRMGTYLSVDLVRDEELVVDNQQDEKMDDSLSDVNVLYEKLVKSMEIVDAESVALKTAQEYINFFEVHHRRPKRVLGGRDRAYVSTSTPEQKEEHRLAQWMGRMKHKRKMNTLYPSVEQLMVQALGATWYDKVDLVAIAVARCQLYIQWSRANGREPRRVLAMKTKRNGATDAQKVENTLAEWMQDARKVKKGKNTHHNLYQPVDEMLTAEFGDEWYTDKRRCT